MLGRVSSKSAVAPIWRRGAVINAMADFWRHHAFGVSSIVAAGIGCRLIWRSMSRACRLAMAGIMNKLIELRAPRNRLHRLIAIFALSFAAVCLRCHYDTSAPSSFAACWLASDGKLYVTPDFKPAALFSAIAMRVSTCASFTS